MPIQVYIEVNGRPVTTVHIGRLKGSTDPGSVNTYSAVAKDSKVTALPEGRRYTTDYPTNHEWDNGAIFEHRYGDGIESCVAKALDELTKHQDMSYPKR
jgi:hypothetical protein